MSSAIGPSLAAPPCENTMRAFWWIEQHVLSLPWLSTLHTHTHTHTHGRAHTYAQARRHRQTLCTLSKPEIFFPSGDQTRPLQVCKTGPWLLAVGAGWWHVWREAGSSSQYEPIQRQWARDRSACLYVPLLCKLIGTRPTSAHKIQRGFLSFFLSFFWIQWLARPQVQPSCRKSSTDPVPSPPHPLCRQRAGENRIRDTDEAPLRCSRPRWREAGVAEAHRRVTIIIHREKKIPEYLQTHLRMRCIGDLKGQIRWFLTLSARSLPVFTEPNASPSVASVCPLLYTPPPSFPPFPSLRFLPSLPFLPLSFSLPPSDPVTAPFAQGLQNKHSRMFARSDRTNSSKSPDGNKIQICLITERICWFVGDQWGLVNTLLRFRNLVDVLRVEWVLLAWMRHSEITSCSHIHLTMNTLLDPSKTSFSEPTKVIVQWLHFPNQQVSYMIF